jgi:hypothetical protein
MVRVPLHRGFDRSVMAWGSESGQAAGSRRSWILRGTRGWPAFSNPSVIWWTAGPLTSAGGWPITGA